MINLETKELIKLMISVPVSGPILDVRFIPEPIRSEMLSSYNFESGRFPEGDGPLFIEAKNFAFWCGYRISPSFKLDNYREFSISTIENLKVKTRSSHSERVPTAVFKPGGYFIDLMSNDGKERLGRVAWGVPHQTFELRHCEWICTSLAISTYETENELVVYTKSGSDYRLEKPYESIERPIGVLSRLRQGFSPDDIEIIKKMEENGISVGSPIY